MCDCMRCQFDRTAPPPEPFFDRVQRVVDDVNYRRPTYRFEVSSVGDRVSIELWHFRPDAVTGAPTWGRGGKRAIPPDATDSAIVRTLVGAALSYEEHEVREFFTYKGARIYGPHIDVEALVEIADRVDFR